eukprot:scaffold3282_cov198-Alexandrium_tamarense.AAC.43
MSLWSVGHLKSATGTQSSLSKEYILLTISPQSDQQKHVHNVEALCSWSTVLRMLMWLGVKERAQNMRLFSIEYNASLTFTANKNWL